MEVKAAGGGAGKVRTELGGIALCITSAVGFLAIAAGTKGNFAFWEWWFFVLAGTGWITWFADKFLKLHFQRFLLEEHGKLIDHERGLLQSQRDTLSSQLDAAERLAPVVAAMREKPCHGGQACEGETKTEGDQQIRVEGESDRRHG